MLNEIFKTNLSSIKSFILILIIAILFFAEQSLTPAIAIDKNFFWSIYNFKIGLITIVDLIFISFAFILLSKFIFSNLNFGNYCYYLFFFYFFFLIIGILYNIFINFNLKALLFDIKIVSYFLITYLILINFFPNSRFDIKYIIFIIVIIFLGSILDNLIVNKYYTPQYYSRFFEKIYFKNEIYSPLLIGLCFFNNFKIYIKFILFFILGIFIYLFYDIYSLGNIYSSIVNIYFAILIILLDKLEIKKNYLKLFFIFFNIFLLMHVIPTSLIFIKNIFSTIKVDGWLLRELVFYNFMKNSLNDFSIIFGKGIGVTWKEYFSSGYSNIYSTGPFAGEYKYILHSSIARPFLLWGVFGYAFLVWFIYSLGNKIKKINKINNNLLFYYLITIVYIAIISPGILKISIIAGIILYFIDRELYYKSLNEN